MGDSGGGKNSVAVLRGSTGLSQADNQVYNQFRKMSSALIVAKQKMVEFSALFYSRQPVSNYTGHTTLQYLGHSFLFHPGSRFASEHLVAEEFGEFPGFEWFHDDFVRFEKDSVHSALHVGISADKQRKPIRLG